MEKKTGKEERERIPSPCSSLFSHSRSPPRPFQKQKIDQIIFLPPVPVHPHIYSNGHICLSVLSSGNGGDYSPALTAGSLALSIRSMLASCVAKERPPGDKEYCSRAAGRSPKETRWEFHDDKV